MKILSAVALLSVLLCACAANVLTDLSKKDRPDDIIENSSIRLDNDPLFTKMARTCLQSTLYYMSQNPKLFPDKVSKEKLFSREEKLELWNTWARYVDCHIILEKLTKKYKDYADYKDEDKKQKAFEIYRAAFNAQYRFALEFINRADNNRELHQILNEPVPELGMPNNTYSSFKFHYLNLLQGMHFSAIETIRNNEFSEGKSELLDLANQDAKVIWEMGKGKGELMTLRNALNIVKDAGKSIWLPIQTKVSGFMGDAKVSLRKSGLISEGQMKSLLQKLEPGDVFLERHEWYLSNLGLPGFWTHAALYVGSPDERKAYFSDPEVIEWVKKQGQPDGNLESLLATKYPKAISYRLERDKVFEPRIMEAISEGVTLTSLEFAAESDSIAVLRPRVSKLDKAKAIYKAFHFAGRPYDFDFDFQSDATLVCTELVYKSYEGILNFKISKTMGRFVLSANDIAKEYEKKSKTQSKQLDFVAFLDGNEYKKDASAADEDSFLKSWRRPDWHIISKF